MACKACVIKSGIEVYKEMQILNFVRNPNHSLIRSRQEYRKMENKVEDNLIKNMHEKCPECSND